MRILLISCFFSLIFNTTTSIFGQNEIEFGGIGGFNLSNVVGSDVSDDNGLRVGLHLGGYAQFEIDSEFGFRPELHILSVKGTSSGGFRTIYMDFPLLATYQLAEKFKAMAGVQPSLLLTARVDDGRGTITNDIRTIDLGFVLGGWYELDEKWGIGARFVPGISRVGASGQERSYNFNFQLSVGYRFL
ncbi:porin family protein [Aquimarina agarivorans]|uniref:porin family protein n=1 Tax=Aquimarina agarivorans TaxID=980584 RepID=UPI000248F57E|nr:porin family protein [Aquimarina agarivorans]